MYVQDGAGLGMSFRDVMDLELADMERLLERLNQAIEAKVEAERRAWEMARKR